MGKKHKDKLRHNSEGNFYRFYFGIPHAHTSNSTGKGTPLEALQYAKSKGLHFLIITDHNKYLHHNVKESKKESTKWNTLLKIVDRFNKKNKYFLGVRGFELKLRGIGDINIINSKSHIKGAIKNLKNLLLWLQDEKCIGVINHPGSSIEKIKPLLELNKYIRLMEVGNGSPPYKYTRYYKYFYKFLDAGWKIGAVNGQDNHLDNWGDTNNLTVVLSSKISSKHILEALSERRTYSTESRYLKLIFKINEVIMGGTVKTSVGSSLQVDINAEDTEIPIEKIQLISCGGKNSKGANM